VVPCERLIISLKPVNFFWEKSGIDVQEGRRVDNGSVPVMWKVRDLRVRVRQLHRYSTTGRSVDTRGEKLQVRKTE
jgi:mannose/cellobiose epimerase-like protein (N-acyl-D-glucosamine 2-epimerase family)